MVGCRVAVLIPCQGVQGIQVTAAGDGQLEAVYMEALLVGVGQQSDKVMFL